MGVRSTALRFGDSTKTWVSGFGIACISALALSGFNADIGIYNILALYFHVVVSLSFSTYTYI